jgi:hypothetical protein
VEDRVDCIGGDFFELVPDCADSYLVSFIIHDTRQPPAVERRFADPANLGSGRAVAADRHFPLVFPGRFARRLP